MKRRITKLIAIAAAVMMFAGCLAGCKQDNTGGEVKETEVSEDLSGENSDVAGDYVYTENAMDGSLQIPWTLTLNGDGTYILTEENPFMGKMEHKGTYTYEGDVLHTSAFDVAPQVVADFLNNDTSCDWKLDIKEKTCTPVDEADDSIVENDTETVRNKETVAYASESASQVCDIYLPDGDEPFPVIILVHGGGFQFGDQGMPLIKPVIDAGIENGYAVVSVDYRKSAEAIFPAAVSDVKAAVRFVKANAEEYGFDVEHIAIWGESAGAYLSLMTALTPEVSELNGDVTDNSEQTSSVTALVDFYGPVEFYTMDEEYQSIGVEDTSYSSADSFESKFLGQPIGEDKDATYQTYWETYKSRLPENYKLSAWIQVGNADEKVPYTQSKNFAERLSETIGSEYVHFEIIDGAGHEDEKFYSQSNLDKVFAFLDSVMK